MQKEHFSLPHRTEDFNSFYPRKSELHYCKKKNANTLCKAGQMLKSPVYLKAAHFACVSHIRHLRFWHSLQNPSSWTTEIFDLSPPMGGAQGSQFISRNGQIFPLSPSTFPTPRKMELPPSIQEALISVFPQNMQPELQALNDTGKDLLRQLDGRQYFSAHFNRFVFLMLLLCPFSAFHYHQQILRGLLAMSIIQLVFIQFYSTLENKYQRLWSLYSQCKHPFTSSEDKLSFTM